MYVAIGICVVTNVFWLIVNRLLEKENSLLRYRITFEMDIQERISEEKIWIKTMYKEFTSRLILESKSIDFIKRFTDPRAMRDYYNNALLEINSIINKPKK